MVTQVILARLDCRFRMNASASRAYLLIFACVSRGCIQPLFRVSYAFMPAAYHLIVHGIGNRTTVRRGS